MIFRFFLTSIQLFERCRILVCTPFLAFAIWNVTFEAALQDPGPSRGSRCWLSRRLTEPTRERLKSTWVTEIPSFLCHMVKMPLCPVVRDKDKKCPLLLVTPGWCEQWPHECIQMVTVQTGKCWGEIPALKSQECGFLHLEKMSWALQGVQIT